MSSEGVIYVATGDDFIEEAKLSARQLKSVVPSVNATLFCDQAEVNGAFDYVKKIPNPKHDYYDKIRQMQETPYDKTIYFDTDIYPTSDFRDLFELLDAFEIGAAHDPTQSSLLKEGLYEQVPASFPEYNTGVLAFQSTDTVLSLLREWQTEYERKQADHPHDQASFRKVVYESDLRLATLPRTYNCLCRESDKVCGPVSIFHGRLTSVAGPGSEKRLDIKDCIEEINSRSEPRVYARKGNQVKLIDDHASLSLRERLHRSLRQNGLVGTVDKIIQKIT